MLVPCSLKSNSFSQKSRRFSGSTADVGVGSDAAKRARDGEREAVRIAVAVADGFVRKEFQDIRRHGGFVQAVRSGYAECEQLYRAENRPVVVQ